MNTSQLMIEDYEIKVAKAHIQNNLSLDNCHLY